MDSIKWAVNNMPKTEDKNLHLMSPEESQKVRAFHESFPQYTKTPLVKLDNMADFIGVKNIFVKDESYRFGLNAFKVLGGSYAIAKYIAKKTDKDISELPYSNLNYDDCVRKAASNAEATENGVIVQDTAWEGYEEIPTWIMQGYGTMAFEADEQLNEYGCKRPTHIFIQAGVGSLAGAVQGYYANRYFENEPIVVVVEADVAACLYKGAVAGDGSPQTVGGDMITLMNGLACGEPNIISWDILKNHVNTFVACEDSISAKGMRLLAAPIKGDVPVTSGESGAVTMGLLYTIMTDDNYKDLREQLKLDENSEVLLFSTECDTDPERYRQVVWNGLNSI